MMPRHYYTTITIKPMPTNTKLMNDRIIYYNRNETFIYYNMYICFSFVSIFISTYEQPNKSLLYKIMNCRKFIKLRAK